MISVAMLMLLFNGCATNFGKTVQITPENFEQYFNISVTTSDFDSGGHGYGLGPLLSGASVNVKVTITPKQTISSGSVNAVLEEDSFVGWNCEYSTKVKTNSGGQISNGLRIPVQFSPNQAYVIEFKMKSTLPQIVEPTFNFDIVEASGTIIL